MCRCAQMNSLEHNSLSISTNFISLINRILIIILFILAPIYDNRNISHLCIKKQKINFYWLLLLHFNELKIFSILLYYHLAIQFHTYHSMPINLSVLISGHMHTTYDFIESHFFHINCFFLFIHWLNDFEISNELTNLFIYW